MTGKIELRRAARALRQTLFAQNPDAGVQLAANFGAGPLQAWRGTRKPVIAGYWPCGSEIDTKALLWQLVFAGYPIALPVSGAKGSPLVFRQWRPGTILQRDAMGLQAPPITETELTPDIVLAPALAFDRAGHRLGYGAGYYDITLAGLPHCLVVIAAFAAQEIPAIPSESHDRPANWIVTEIVAWPVRL